MRKVSDILPLMSPLSKRYKALLPVIYVKMAQSCGIARSIRVQRHTHHGCAFCGSGRICRAKIRLLCAVQCEETLCKLVPCGHDRDYIRAGERPHQGVRHLYPHHAGRRSVKRPGPVTTGPGQSVDKSPFMVSAMNGDSIWMPVNRPYKIKCVSYRKRNLCTLFLRY